MKKLIVLSLVVAMASIASAGLSFEGGVESIVTGDITWTLVGNQLIGTGTSAGVTVDMYLQDVADGIITGGTVNTAVAGDNAKFFSPMSGWYSVYAQDLNNEDGGQTANTTWFTIDIDLGGKDKGTLTAYGFGDLVIVPEPMTMGLLGLGGLFLRRRK